MNKKSFLYVLAMLGIVATVSSFHLESSKNAEIEAVKDLVESAYLNGAFNDLDTKSMAEGFHPDFAIFSASGEQIERYPIATWVDAVEKRKAKADFDPASQQYDYKLPYVDVTGGSAGVKVELFQSGEHVYTDYLSLLKFDSGWKIVAKVYHYHKQ